MNEKLRQVEEIDATQEALRQSIEKSRHLAEKAENLIRKHKQALQDDEPTSATGSSRN